MSDFTRLRAFAPGPMVERAPTADGPLAGRDFAVKDLIDVAGCVTGAGNPDWAAAHAPAERNAPCVAALLDAGARLRGKTITDELAFSLEGANHHYGSPLNPRAPLRLSGGSSSGSASAVAGGAVDFALGTDTGGSVRAPAAFCGLFGLRPTHGAITLAGVVPFAPGYDTVGVMARDAGTLRKVAEVLLPRATTAPKPRFLIASDAFALADTAVAATLENAMPARLRGAQPVEIFEGGPEPWLEAYRVLQGWEIWQTLGPWIERTKPRFGPSIAERFADAARITEAEATRWRSWRETARARLASLFGEDGVLILPTTPTVAPLREARGAEIADFYARALPMMAIAGHAGAPQITLPLGQADGAPVGLSLVGPANTDLALVALAGDLAEPSE